MFKKILVANRGEIACRVIKTARRLGIKTVAIYSDVDRNSLHTRLADEAIFIGSAPSTESYLVIDNILAAVRVAGADAVHPGYGFLSENASFAKMLAKEGVTFIGPPPFAISAMGDKIESKKIAENNKVNTVPGHLEAIRSPEEAIEVSRKIGYPVMLKASAGGGGKGMRVVLNDKQCREGLKRTVNEAKSSFGDERVFIEKFIETPRHIEIQIIADKKGKTLYLGERECSVQRRHQKVIEEAPSPFLDPDTRKAMGEQAVALAKAVGYYSAGTVEFIVDENKKFYFLEMNTRLQVEHPVTELTTGFDIVELMIRIAAGEDLGFKQQSVKLSGWAIEARIYAEDPSRNFLPSTGRLIKYQSPEESDHVRIDTGVYEGGQISIYYDPMIAKLTTFGADREEAISYMRDALDVYFIRGVDHNISFLAALIAHPRFIKGDINTNFIAEEFPEGFDPYFHSPENPNLLIAVVAAVHHSYHERAAKISGQIEGHNTRVQDEWVVILNDKNHSVTVGYRDCGFKIIINGETLSLLTNWHLGESIFQGTFQDSKISLQIRQHGLGYRLIHRGSQNDFLVLNKGISRFNELMPDKHTPDTSRKLLSPMPGLLVSMAVVTGQKVKAGETLAVIEAMKMENVLFAEKDVVIAAVNVGTGDTLAVDQVIMEFE